MATPEPAAGQTLLRMRELAEASGVPPATIKHYLREGLLPEPVRTSRNMAWYPAEFVDRIRLIKQLQEERFLPLKVIRELLDSGEEEPEKLRALVELEDRILERALASRDRSFSMAPEEVADRYEMPVDLLERLEKMGVISRDEGRFGPEDVEIVEAISRMRAGGYSEQIGFTIYDVLLYKEPIEDLVKREVSTLTERMAGEMPVERALELIEAADQPARDLIGALRSKLLVEELRRQRAAARGDGGP